MTTLLSDDLMALEVIRDPHSYYRRLPGADPVRWNDRWGGWILTRYEDVVRVLRDAERFSSDRMGYLARELTPEERELSRWMAFSDPLLHTRLRTLLNREFTPRRVELYQRLARGIVDGLLEAIEPRGRMEVVRDFAYQVPMTVILELMGAPPSRPRPDQGVVGAARHPVLHPRRRATPP